MDKKESGCMRKTTYIITVMVLAVVGFVVFSFFVGRNYSFPRTGKERDELEAILRDFDVKVWFQKKIKADEIQRWLDTRDEVVVRLQELGTNILPQLMEKVREAGRIAERNPSAGMELNAQLAFVFQVLGSNAAPLLPELIKEYQAGRSIGPALAGIVAIGATEGGLAIVPGLTNVDPGVRLATISAISYFRTNSVVVDQALPLLLKNLGDALGSVRAAATSVLGSFRSQPEVVIPALIKLAETDEDLVVRSVAIKAIGQFGSEGAIALSNLERIARFDSEDVVRRAATNAIGSIKGETGK
jgi:hypothetical protein